MSPLIIFISLMSNNNFYQHCQIFTPCLKHFTAILVSDLRVEKELECPAIREVVLRRPRVGGIANSSLAVRGTELARVDTESRRSGWSSLRLRRRRLFLWSLKLRPLRRLMRLCETISSKRCLCFLGMKILRNMVQRGRKIHSRLCEETLTPGEKMLGGETEKEERR